MFILWPFFLGIAIIGSFARWRGIVRLTQRIKEHNEGILVRRGMQYPRSLENEVKPPYAIYGFWAVWLILYVAGK